MEAEVNVRRIGIHSRSVAGRLDEHQTADHSGSH